jgi:L-xylulokinase
MSAAAYLLGIDNGGTVTKAALYDTSGTEIAVASVKTPMVFPHPGHAEKDMEELWAANARVISDVLAKAKIDAKQVAGVAVTGHGNGLYLVDADGKPVRNGINSADSRATDIVEGWYKDGTCRRVLPRICQSIWPAQPAGLLPWLRDNEPAALQKTRWIFMCKDYIRFRLTGEAWAEITDYSGTSLANVRELRYDQEILDAYGIGFVREKLPPLRGSAEICGRVTRAAAAATGLAEGTPVTGGLFDIDAGALATGITRPGQLCLIAGSWSINECISPVPIESPDLFMTSSYCMPGFWLITEGSATSASNLEWMVAEVMGAEAREAKAAGRSVYDACNALVESVAPADSQVVFLPFLYGTNVGPKASSCLFGLHGWHTKAHLLRAVYEGIVFSHRTHVERLVPFAGAPQSARIAGGAAKSPVWVQMFADALGIPIELTACEELGALGAAMCAGIGVGLFGSYPEAVTAMVRVSRTIEPRRENAAVYGEKYRRYGRCVAAMQAAAE